MKTPKHSTKPSRSYHFPTDGLKYEMEYEDSLFGTKMAITTDGRHRGLWVWIADEINTVVKNDIRIFEEGLKRFTKYLASEDYKKNPEMMGFMLRSIHFDYFFGHRIESTGVRMTWKQTRDLHTALGEALKTEVKEEDYENQAPSP